MKKQVRKADQAKIRQRKHIAFRMNFLFFSIFILFSLLILRLGYLQIVKGEDYTRLLEQKEEKAVNTNVARGRIFDRTGRLLVGNDPKNAITYTKTLSTTSQEMLDTARELAKMIDQNTKRITLADKRDFWILLNSEKAIAKVSKKEEAAIRKDNSLAEKDVQRELNRLTRERITEDERNSFTKEELEVLAIYREMMSGYADSPQIIKNEDVTDEEFAAVSEHLMEPLMTGVDTTTDWERVKMSESTILGSTTSPIQGIPDSHLNYYLARDYSRNDRVGRSYIEQYYEELLKGQKTIVKNVRDRSGRIVETKTVREGEPGKDLMLSIDSELQEGLEDLVSAKLLKLKAGPNSKLLDRAFLVMLDPNTGEVLSLVGKKIVKNEETGKNEIRDFTFGTFSTAYEVGSVIKPATLLAGYQYGAARINETKIDEPLIVGNVPKSSLFNQYGRVAVNDIEAIGRSSNVYMFKIAMEIANYSYVRNGRLRIDFGAFDKLRDSYASFGLGTKTGIDLPGEVTGMSTEPNRKEPGKLLDLAIGQFDTYTPLQIAQFVATIANGGYRIAPKMLKQIHEPSSDGKTFGPLIQENETTVLNRINNTDEEIEQVKRGMHYTYYDPRGTGRADRKGLFDGASYDAAGKTGTAQSGYYEGDDRSLWGTKTITVTHVGFAPYKNPEIAFAVIVPHVSTQYKNPPHPNNELARSAADLYFELKGKRLKNEKASASPLPIKPAHKK
ncbi:peptidoglycan D,D-transpeptidase FtsI family protein [Sporosarcina limicola]|uniref:Cell division protein FtsI/penicillin-binding protein 2 n=1 Tax=Sporosarcina limicola TaxID=34101 RepID=A0A927MH92_9BACL|nr:penicillin-binding protein 2 [Sporosarcina limicola]MBE1553746.1 cell division protein FtsI/penicillin-binding protein 2 [Sporosarcina limicola]